MHQENPSGFLIYMIPATISAHFILPQDISAGYSRTVQIRIFRSCKNKKTNKTTQESQPEGIVAELEVVDMVERALKKL